MYVIGGIKEETKSDELFSLMKKFGEIRFDHIFIIIIVNNCK
jgi:hypothetical protein